MRITPMAVALAMVVCGAALSACLKDEVLEPAPLPAGAYRLVSVGGQPLPAVMVPPGGPRTYLAGSLDLAQDQSFVQATDIQRCQSAGACTTSTVTVHGTWSVLPDGTLAMHGDAGESSPPPLIIARAGRITICSTAAGQPCQPDLVYQHR
jgi:hypothetical protein